MSLDTSICDTDIKRGIHFFIIFFLFCPLTLKRLKGRIALGSSVSPSFRPSVCASVTKI